MSRRTSTKDHMGKTPVATRSNVYNKGGGRVLSTPRNGRKRSRDNHGIDATAFVDGKNNSRAIDVGVVKFQRKSSKRTEDNLSDETEDQFAGIDDDDIRQIDETPFKNYVNSSIATKTPRNFLSTVMQSSIARAVTLEKSKGQQNAPSSFSLADGEAHQVSNLDFNEDSRDGEEYDEELSAMLSLNQLTQEEVDVAEMFNLRDSTCRADSVAIEELDREQDETKLTELKQPTLSQYYSKKEKSTRPAPRIQNYMEYNGRHFMKGDIWQLAAIPEKAKNHVYSKMIVKIKSFKTEKREKIAYAEHKIYLPIQNVPVIGDYAQSIIENRRSKGNLGPDFVEYILGTSSLSSRSAIAPPPRFPLQILDNHIRETIISDLIFGYEENGGKKPDFYFKFRDVTLSEMKQTLIPKKNGKFTALELYSGAGGFSLGLREAGFRVTHHVDNDTAACATLQANFGGTEVLQCTVEDFLIGCKENLNSKRYPKPGSVTMIHGSPPCQGFSLANRNGGANDAANNAETNRFMEVVKYFQPPFVTFENVEGMEQKKHKRYLQKMIAQFLNMEYQVRLCHVLASDYGDPQNRRRIFILAAKAGLELPDLPQATHGLGAPLLPKKTNADAIGFLEKVLPLEYEGEISPLVEGEVVHLRGHVLRVSERSNDDVLLEADAQAATVLKQRVIRHYKCNKRPLTRLERSLLQSFPLSFIFNGTDSEIRDQIGNAVPVRLSAAIAKSVMEAIRKSVRSNRPIVDVEACRF